MGSLYIDVQIYLYRCARICMGKAAVERGMNGREGGGAVGVCAGEFPCVRNKGV